MKYIEETHKHHHENDEFIGSSPLMHMQSTKTSWHNTSHTTRKQQGGKNLSPLPIS
jgi:hypothetical protein